MKQHIRERVKFFILIMLIFTSLIQVGILWSYQNHGFPIYFLSWIFSSEYTSTSPDFQDIKAEYFKPYKIIMTQGYDNPHWVITRKEKEFDILWEEAKDLYLKKGIFKAGKPTEVVDFTEEAWGTLVSKRKIFVFEFSSNIRMDAIKWFIDSDAQTGELSSIYKIIIAPADEENNGADTVYIRNENKIFKYSLSVKDAEALSTSGFERISKKLNADKSRPVYLTTNEGFRNIASFVGQDILVSPKSREFANVTTLLPELNLKKSGYSSEELNDIGAIILGIEKDLYIPDEDMNGAAVFKKIGNTYKLNKNGVLEYNYRDQVQDSEKANINDALSNAIKFIDQKKNLVKGVDIYLSGIGENKDSDNYVFTFDYSISMDKNIGDIPININAFDLQSNGKTKRLANAITIETNGKKIFSCWWVLREFTQANDTAGYDVSFESLMDKTFEDYSDLKSKKTKSKETALIQDIIISYDVSVSAEIKSILLPKWVMVTKDARYSTELNLQKQK